VISGDYVLVIGPCPLAMFGNIKAYAESSLHTCTCMPLSQPASDSQLKAGCLATYRPTDRNYYFQSLLACSMYDNRQFTTGNHWHPGAAGTNSEFVV